MKGNLLVVSAPSGAGKTTLVRGLLASDPLVRLSVSYTTRAPRPGEQDGLDYHFVGVERFLSMREAGEFVESAEVHGNYYGTSRRWLSDQAAAGQDVVLEIDWQGAQQVRAALPGTIGIFVLPPSIDELERRLRNRGQDSEEVVLRRVAAALSEMRHVGEYEYVIINNELEAAQRELGCLVRSLRLRLSNQMAQHADVFRFLEKDT